MKAKSNIPKVKKTQLPELNAAQLHAESHRFKFPGNPLVPLDRNDLPQIKRAEIMEYTDALYQYRLARAYFERTHSDLLYKLTIGCAVEPKSEIKVKLNPDGEMVFTETCGTCLSKFDPRW